MKKSTAREQVVEPTPVEPTQAELDRIAQRRLTEDSTRFLERIFPDPTKRNWLQVCSGEPDALGGGFRNPEICRYLAGEWVILGHGQPKEAPETLAGWLESRRSFSAVWFCPALTTIPSDQAPLHPLSVLFTRVAVPPLPHEGSGGAFSMASLTKLAEVRKGLLALDPRPSFLVNEWTGIAAYWCVDEGIEPDLGAAWLNKISMITRGTSLTPRSFMLLPGQAPKRIIPLRSVEVTEDSGAVYTRQDMFSWLGAGMPIKTREDAYRDRNMAIRRARAYGHAGQA